MTQQVDPQGAGSPVDSLTGSVDSIGTDDVVLPQQQRSSEHSGPIPRPFAMGSVTRETTGWTVPAPRRTPEEPERSGGVLAPPRPVDTTTTPARGRRTTILLIGAVIGVVLLLAGLYTASVLRDRSPDAGAIAPAADLHDVTYRVTTSGGSHVVVSYSESKNGDYSAGSASDVASPWSVDTRVSDYYGPSVTATVVPADDGSAATDTITCTIVRNGRTIAQETQTGPDATVSCLP